MLVIEDLHWLDPTSLELLRTLAEQGAGMPLLLLCTARPEFHASWPARSHHIQIALGGLASAEMRSLVAGLAAGDNRTYVDREDVVDYVAGFRPPHATDEAGDERRARNAVAGIVKAGLLIGAVGDDRYEVSEAVEPLLPLELLTELLVALRTANGSPVDEVDDAFDELGADPAAREQEA